MSSVNLLPEPHRATTTSEEELDQIILENLQSQNDIEYALGDTLDIKTSIALVVIIFLAAQSSGFLAAHMPHHWYVVQIVSVGCLIASGGLSVWELLPRIYKVGLAPEEFSAWIQRVKGFYSADGVPDPDAKTVAFIRRKKVEQLQKRFTANSKVNAMKSLVVTGVFILTLGSLGLNLATLIALSSGWRF